MAEIIEDAPVMAPVASSERVDVIDILRGMALFGILAANMRGFDAPMQYYYGINRMFPSTSDQIGQGFIDLFIQGKFITLFSLLFGLGFAIQISRAEERGKSVSFYPRRLFLLLCFGLIHAWLIWWGDILACYAVAGVALLLFRRFSQKTILIVAIVLLAASFATMLQEVIQFYRHPWAAKPSSDGIPQTVLNIMSVYREGSFLAMTKARILDWRQLNWPPIWLVTFILPRFLLGLWVWRTGVLKDISASLPVIRKVCIWSLAIGVLFDGIYSYFRWIAVPPRGLPTLAAFARDGSHEVAGFVLGCFYGCLVVILVQAPAWKTRLTPFAAVGRTALTNYLLQSLVCVWFFHWTKLYGSVGPAAGLIPTVVLFALQVPVSVWWMQRYEFGPAEWIWRSLTYGRIQPFRRVDSGSAIAVPAAS
jgi:uncharacterized protein